MAGCPMTPPFAFDTMTTTPKCRPQSTSGRSAITKTEFKAITLNKPARTLVGTRGPYSPAFAFERLQKWIEKTSRDSRCLFEPFICTSSNFATHRQGSAPCEPPPSRQNTNSAPHAVKLPNIMMLSQNKTSSQRRKSATKCKIIRICSQHIRNT